jgi:hypothetical protein
MVLESRTHRHISWICCIGVGVQVEHVVPSCLLTCICRKGPHWRMAGRTAKVPAPFRRRSVRGMLAQKMTQPGLGYLERAKFVSLPLPGDWLLVRVRVPGLDRLRWFSWEHRRLHQEDFASFKGLLSGSLLFFYLKTVSGVYFCTPPGEIGHRIILVAVFCFGNPSHIPVLGKKRKPFDNSSYIYAGRC